MVEFVKLKKKDEKKEDKKKQNITLKKIFIFILFFFIFSSIISSFFYSISPKIAVIKIQGIISVNEENSLYQTSISSRKISQNIRDLSKDETIKAILIDINSPGGSPVASEEISKAIEFAKQKKPVYSLINDLGASGAFWVAVSANKTYASSMSILGSIGVTSAGLGFENFIKNYNITYRKLTAGKFKDIGSPFRKPTKEEEQIIQNMLNEIHNKFIKHIARNRNLDYEYVKKYSTGEIFLGSKAKKLKFIDEIGYYDDVIEELKNITNSKDAIIIEFGREPTLAELLGINNIFKIPSTKLNELIII